VGSTACRQYALPVAIIVILLLLSTSDFDALAGTNELDLQEMAAQPVHVTNQTDSDGDGVHDGDDACPGTTAGTPVNATGCPEEAIFVWPDGVGGYHQGSKHYNMTSNSSLATLYEVDHMVDNATYLIEWYVTNASATTTTTTTNNNTTVTTTQVSTVASGSITTNNSNNSGSSALLHAAISLPDGCYEVWAELHNKDTNQFRDDDEFILCIGTITTTTTTTNTTNATTPETPDSDGDGVPDAEDKCPETDAGAIVDIDGCAANQYDTDGDGVHDGDDACPRTPVGTEVNSFGCPEEEDSSPAAEEEEAEAALVPGFSILSTVAGVVLAAMVITSRRIGQECLDR